MTSALKRLMPQGAEALVIVLGLNKFKNMFSVNATVLPRKIGRVMVILFANI